MDKIEITPKYKKTLEKVVVELTIEDAKILRTLLGQTSGAELSNKLAHMTNVTPVPLYNSGEMSGWLARFSNDLLMVLNNKE